MRENDKLKKERQKSKLEDKKEGSLITLRILFEIYMAKANIRPLFDRVLIALAKREKETLGGILLPETEKMDKGTKGVVMAVGSGRVSEAGTVIPMTVKKGDTVIFSKYGAEDVKIDGTEYFLLREDQLLAIIEG